MRTKYFNPSALDKANSAFDKEVRTIMREWQQLSAFKGVEKDKKAKEGYLTERAKLAMFKYLNDVEQAREVGQGGKKASVFTLADLEALKPDKGSGLDTALSNFKDSCEAFSTNIRNAALAKNTNGGSAKNVLEFAEDRSKIVELFSAVIAACVLAFVAYEKDLISLAKFTLGKNSEGVNFALATLVVLAGFPIVHKIAYMCTIGDSEGVKTAVAEIHRESDEKAEAFKELATKASEERSTLRSTLN